MTPRRGKLIVLSAPSGTGKSTLAAMLLERHKRIKLSVSTTTRPPRGEEKHGVHYYFVSEPEFKNMITRGEFLEYAHVFQKYYYGTSKDKVESELAKGHHVLFDIDVQGAESLKHLYKDDCVTIFILPPSFEELEARLRARNTETEEAIQMRLITARKELDASDDFDFRVVNQDLDQAYGQIETVLRSRGLID